MIKKHLIFIMARGMFSILLIFVAFAFSAQCYGEEAIKIGIITDLTGGDAEVGRSERDALKMVFDEANEAGMVPGRKIEYASTLGDERADPDKATSLAKRYMEADNVLLLRCCTTSAAGLAVVRVASEAGVPVTGLAFAVDLHKGILGKWFFASASNNEEIAVAWLEMVKRDGYKKVAIGWVNSAWGRDAKDNIYRYASKYGINVIGDVPVEMGASEATAEVQKLKAMNPEALILSLYAKDMAAAARGVAANGWNLPIYGTPTAISPAMKMAGTDLMEKWRGPFLVDPNAPEVLKVVNKFKSKYGTTPSEISIFMQAWDATNVLIQVFKTMAEKKEPFTRANLRDALEKYSEGVPLLSPTPRKSPGWKQPPHILIHGKDFLPMMVSNGKLVKY